MIFGKKVGCVDMLDPEKELSDPEKEFAQDRSSRVPEHIWQPNYTRILMKSMQTNKTDTEIAKELKISASTVKRVKTLPIYKERLLTLTRRIEERTYGKAVERESFKNLDKAREHLEKSALRAAKKVTGILRKGRPEDRIRFDAAKDILDRVGVKAAQVIETHDRVYSPEEIGSSKDTLLEMEAHLERVSTTGSAYVIKGPKSLVVEVPPESSQTDTGSMLENSTARSTPDTPLEAPNLDTPSGDQSIS